MRGLYDVEIWNQLRLFGTGVQSALEYDLDHLSRQFEWKIEMGKDGFELLVPSSLIYIRLRSAEFNKN